MPRLPAKRIVDPLLACLQDHLAARTGAWAREESVDRNRNYYAIDGELVMLEETYGERLEVVWTEQRFCSIGRHAAGDCVMIVPATCD